MNCKYRVKAQFSLNPSMKIKMATETYDKVSVAVLEDKIKKLKIEFYGFKRKTRILLSIRPPSSVRP